MEIVKTKCLTCNNWASEPTYDWTHIIGSTETVTQLNKFCSNCRRGIRSRAERYQFTQKRDNGDFYDSVVEVITENDISEFIIEKLSAVSDRLKKGLPLTQCAATGFGTGGDKDMQCHHYAMKEVGGLPLCGVHAHRAKRYGHVNTVTDTEYSGSNLLEKYARMFLADIEKRSQ